MVVTAAPHPTPSKSQFKIQALLYYAAFSSRNVRSWRPSRDDSPFIRQENPAGMDNGTFLQCLRWLKEDCFGPRKFEERCSELFEKTYEEQQDYHRFYSPDGGGHFLVSY